MISARSGLLPLSMVVMMTACDRAAGSASAAAASSNAAGAAATAPAASASPVRIATKPSDACGWISAAEVAAIVGPLTGTPYPTDDGCVYPLPLDSATARRNAQVLQLRQSVKDTSELSPLEPDTSGVVVDVHTHTAPAMGRGLAASFAKMGQEMCGDSASASEPWCKEAARKAAAPPASAPGWDRVNDTTSRSFYGRVGHLAVDVEVDAAEVSHQQALAIANRVRDAIPDLPFPSERTANAAGPDPCSLLTAEEVEAVLGKLVVSPYRSEEDTPLAMARGKSCSYFTAGHHALVLTPTWEYGGQAFDAMRAVGGLIERVAPVLHDGAADTLDTGPWEDAAGDPATGQLYFLKGDRALELSFLLSSTGFDGAVRLARIAVGRL